jgi:protein-disulfide isomerase
MPCSSINAITSSTSRSPRMLLALIVGVAILVAALMAVLSQLGGTTGSSASSEDVGKLYSGIPENGTTLGKSGALVTIYLYEDFQCPYCGEFSRQMFPRWSRTTLGEGKPSLSLSP